MTSWRVYSQGPKKIKHYYPVWLNYKYTPEYPRTIWEINTFGVLNIDF